MYYKSQVLTDSIKINTKHCFIYVQLYTPWSKVVKPKEPFSFQKKPAHGSENKLSNKRLLVGR